MLFRTILFTVENEPSVLAIISSSNPTSGMIIFCTDQTQANLVIQAQTNHAQRKLVQEQLPHLSEKSDEASVLLTGHAALAISSFIVRLERRDTELGDEFSEPTLCGAWFPDGPDTTETIIAWYHPDTGYQVKIMRSPERICATLREMSWIPENEIAGMIAKIPPDAQDDALHEVTIITGAVAHVICVASLLAGLPQE